MLTSTLLFAQSQIPGQYGTPSQVETETAGASSGIGSGSNAAEFLGGLFDRPDILFHPDELLDALSQLPLIAAAVVVVVGILCVFNGYRWHKWVVAILAFIAGLALGHYLSEQMGKSAIVAVSIGCLCAIIATPLLKITVAIFGGATGAFIGANAWTALEASPADANWAGAAIGFIVIAMTSLILFRLVVVLFTSIGGAAMVIFGGITLMLNVPAWEPSVRESLMAHEMLIPVLMLVAAVSGFVVQESRLRADGVKLMGGESSGSED